MTRRLIGLALVAAALSGCALPPPGQPAHYTRMGRFVGLVANCGCGTGLSESQVLADYRRVVDGRYSEAEIARMRGYVEAGATERYDNQYEICAQICAQPCMIKTVAEPLGGRSAPGVQACAVTERDLHLTLGRYGEDSFP